VRTIVVLGLAAILLGTFGCGGGGTSTGLGSGSTTASNVVPLAVNAGPANNSANSPYVSVTICVPGTGTCQTVSGVLVDTGSVGLRVLSSAISTLPLPAVTLNGVPVANCGQYVDGSFTWGSMRSADVTMGGEKASSIPIQVIGDLQLRSSGVCSDSSLSSSTPSTLMANGILGVGPFVRDDSASYFTCPASGCAAATVTSAQQLANPVAFFPIDNNGVVIQLPAISANGAGATSGSLIFGIGTQSNNGLGSARVVPLDTNGNFTAFVSGVSGSFSSSFMDSGSNTYLLLDASRLTSLPMCTADSTFGPNSGITSFYCPASPVSISGNAGSVPFTITVANAKTLFSANNFSNLAFNNLAAPSTAVPNGSDFVDLGLPFFYGRSVFTAIEGKSTPGGNGPYVAF